MNISTPNLSRPLRVAIVGAGPAGFFTAEELLNRRKDVEVNIYERLTTPYGLVRYGVAPDHPVTRRIIKLFERTATRPGFRFLGGQELGRNIDLASLRADHDAVVLATGAEADRDLGVPGEDLGGVHASLAFAGWCNGHPDFLEEPFDLGVDTVAIVGHGNVALDVARLLCRPADLLRTTDLHPAALERLAAHTVSTIHLIGRRGPAQSAFGPNELEELLHLPDVAIEVRAEDLALDAASETECLQNEVTAAQVERLRAAAARSASSARRRVVFHFLRSPVALLGSARVEGVRLAVNRLEGEPGRQVAVATGQQLDLSAQLVVKAIGHRAVPLPGVPYDPRRGVIPTEGHRVAPGLYAVGWAKRGARGLIGHNRRDAMETVQALLADHPVG